MQLCASLSVCLVFLVLGSDALTGSNVCKRTESQLHHIPYCKFWLFGCWSWGKRTYWSYTVQRHCCSGYRTKNNRCEPYCPRGCNVGTCVAPSYCRCPSTRTGTNCGQPICSYANPCYPGICTYPNLCDCSSAFGGGRCTEITKRPDIMTANVTLEFYDQDSDEITYTVKVVAPEGDSQTLELWSNIGKFNRMDLNMEAFLDLGQLSGKPSYVRAAQFGITEAKIVYTLTKGDGSGRNRTDQVQCSGNLPYSGVVTCPHHVPQFDYRLDNADIFTMKFEVKSGGYMDLIRIGRRRFTGHSKAKQIRVKFDFIPPAHCQEDNACSTSDTKPLQVVKDITREPVTLKWAGWSDALSGMDSFILEIFKLSGEGSILLEKHPMQPESTFNFTQDQGSHTVTPTDPGMYSAILGAKDRANNTRYVREFFLYDATSSITKESLSPLHVSSASAESNYQWQTPNTTGKTSIQVTWTGHFVNMIHRDGGLLNSIRDYPPQLTNKYLSTVEKVISPELKSTAANRTHSNIANINGITRFEIQVESYLIGTELSAPTTGWLSVSPFSEQHTVMQNILQGTCVMAWVKAHDIMGNVATDHAMVCFDASPPVIRRQVDVERNMETTEFYRSSRVSFTALDADSGIAMVTWSLRDNQTKEAITISPSETVPIPGHKVNNTGQDCDHTGDCYCIDTGDCFAYDYALDIDHCLLFRPDLGLDGADVHYILVLAVFNQALQNTTKEYVIEDIQDLEGMTYCARKISERLIQEDGLTAGTISGIVVSALLLLGFAIFVLVLYRTGRLQKVRKRIHSIRRTIHKEHGLNDGLKYYQNGGFDEDDIYMYGHQTYEHAPEWMVRAEDLTLNNILVVGKFARIYEASLIRAARQSKVVAKTLKEGYSEEDSVLMTAKINFFGTKVGRHSCVLEMVGAILEDEKMGPVMVLELCGYGSVKDWLSNNKDRHDESTIDFLFRFVYSIIQGMEYLAGREITHARLAARNILLTEKLEPKIAGFGPRHGDEEEDGEKKERIPVKWIAPECLKSTRKKASEKSDVWSCGVVMWEIFSFGDPPYPKIRSADIQKLIRRGERLGRPEYSDDVHFRLMQNTWKMEPKNRPTFREMREEIENVFNPSGNECYYDSNFGP